METYSPPPVFPHHLAYIRCWKLLSILIEYSMRDEKTDLINENTEKTSLICLKVLLPLLETKLILGNVVCRLMNKSCWMKEQKFRLVCDFSCYRFRITSTEFNMI